MSERLENIFSRDPEIYVSTLLGATELDDRYILFAPDTGIVDGNFNFCFSRVSSVNGDHVIPPFWFRYDQHLECRCRSRNGQGPKPLSPSNIIRRHLHKALKQLNYVNPYTGTHKAGNHAFRRFRNTYLRNYADCPEGLYKYWMGHAGKDMSDLCDKSKRTFSSARSGLSSVVSASNCPQLYRASRNVPKTPKPQ